MKVYRPNNHTVIVTPGALIQGECPSQWLDGKGVFKTFKVQFANGGVAAVDSQLGELMILHNLANRTRLIRAENSIRRALGGSR